MVERTGKVRPHNPDLIPKIMATPSGEQALYVGGKSKWCPPGSTWTLDVDTTLSLRYLSHCKFFLAKLLASEFQKKQFLCFLDAQPHQIQSQHLISGLKHVPTPES